MLYPIFRFVLSASLLFGIAWADKPAPDTHWMSRKPVPIAHWTVTGTHTPVYFVPRHDIPMLDIALVLKAGSARDGKQWGLANITGAVIGTGTHQHSEQQMAERLSDVGASLSTDVTRDAMVIHFRTMTSPHYYHDAIRTWGEAVTQLRVDPAVVKRLKSQTQVVLSAEKDQPSSVAAKALFKTLYGDHPYAHPIKGNASTLASITAADVLRFYQDHAVQNQLSVVLVGDVSLKEAHRLARQVTIALPKGEPLQPLPLRVAPVAPKRVFVPMKKSQDALFIAQLGFLPYDSHFYPRLVGNQAFGGSALTSMLFKEVREKRGLAYYAASQVPSLSAGAPFLMMTQSRLSAARQANSVMRSTFSQFVTKGLSKATLKETKRSLTGQFPLMYASNESILSRMVGMVIYHYPMTFFADYPKRIEAVKNALVQQAFAALVSQQWVQVAAGGINIFKAPTPKRAKR